MKIKKGDKVRIITGKDKYRADNKETYEHEVLACYPKENRILVKDVNVVTRHTKPRKMGDPGGIISAEGAMYASKVMVVCPHCNKPVRVGHKKFADGTKSRICKKCGETL